MSGKRFGISLTLAVLCTSATTLATAASFRGLGDLPGGDVGSSATAISANGQVVVGVAHGEKGQEAFYWTAQDGMVGLGHVRTVDDFSRAWGVSADGSVIVGDGNVRPFVWTKKEGMLALDTLGYPGSRHSAVAVSDDGRVVIGTSKNSDKMLESFVWKESEGMTGLGYLPGEGKNTLVTDLSADGRLAVGWGQTNKRGDVWQPFVQKLGVDAEPRPLGSTEEFGPQARAMGVSGDGEVVVGFMGGVKGFEAFSFRSSGHQLRALGDLPGGRYSSGAHAASADGRVIVGVGSDAQGNVAVVWLGDERIQSIAEILKARGVDLDGWQLHEASDVSADGKAVVGYGTNPEGQREAWIATLDWPLDVAATIAERP